MIRFFCFYRASLSFTFLTAWYSVTAELEGLDSNGLSLLRRAELDDSGQGIQRNVQVLPHKHPRIATKHHKAGQSAQIDANGHMVLQHLGLDVERADTGHTWEKGEEAHHPNMSLVYELYSKKHDFDELNESLVLAIESSGLAKGLPEDPPDEAKDSHNISEVTFLEEARQHRDIKNGKLLGALKQMKEWKSNATTMPRTQKELINAIATINGQLKRDEIFPTGLHDPSYTPPAEGSTRWLAAQGLGANADPASLAELGMVPQKDLSDFVVGFLFGSADVIDEDYPFLCRCDMGAVCVNCDLMTSCQMRRGMANGAVSPLHASWVLSLGFLLSM